MAAPSVRVCVTGATSVGADKTLARVVPSQDEFEADSEGATCLSWNTSRFDTPMLLVGGCGKGHNVKVWGYNADYRKWEVYAEFGHKEVIHDVAWAPSVGRSYHLLASASKDRTLSMWKLTSEGGRVSVKLMDNRPDHNAEVRFLHVRGVQHRLCSPERVHTYAGLEGSMERDRLSPCVVW